MRDRGLVYRWKQLKIESIVRQNNICRLRRGLIGCQRESELRAYCKKSVVTVWVDQIPACRRIQGEIEGLRE